MNTIFTGRGSVLAQYRSMFFYEKSVNPIVFSQKPVYHNNTM